MFVVSGAREHGETRFGFCLFTIELVRAIRRYRSFK
jgi:hypothetical protein